jgi:hypothetical protein
MSIIVTRAGKGAPLTNAELDANFTNLNTDKQEGLAKDASGGYVGLTLFKHNLKNAAGTITSWFTTAAAVARTWTFPDKDGTVAMVADITGVNSGTNTGDQTNIAGNAATVTTNANLTGGVTSLGNSATVVTNANLTGDVTSLGNATTLTNAPVIAKVLTGFISGAGIVAATDSILTAVQKLNGNDNSIITSVQNSGSRWLTSVVGSNAITAAVTPALTAYAAGQTFEFVAATTNTGAATININGLGVVPVTKNGVSAVSAGDIVAGQAYILIRDAVGNFQLSGGSGGGAQAGGSLMEFKTVVSSNYTAPAGVNNLAVGPLTIATGVTYTFNRLVIL